MHWLKLRCDSSWESLLYFLHFLDTQTDKCLISPWFFVLYICIHIRWSILCCKKNKKNRLFLINPHYCAGGVWQQGYPWDIWQCTVQAIYFCAQMGVVLRPSRVVRWGRLSMPRIKIMVSHLPGLTHTLPLWTIL